MSLTARSNVRGATAGRTKLLACLLLGFASTALAEKATELSDDFLEYLGNMEDGDDNWSDFVHDADARANIATNTIVSAHQSSSASSTQSSKRSVDRARADGNSR